VHTLFCIWKQDGKWQNGKLGWGFDKKICLVVVNHTRLTQNQFSCDFLTRVVETGASISTELFIEIFM
jgi:c-di-AMP phosphodiesterase-like protein